MAGLLCTNGHPMGPGDRFCPVCGAAAGGGTPPPPTQTPMPYAAAPPPARSNTWVWIVSTVVVAAAAVAIVLMVTGGDDGTTAAGSSLPSAATSSSLPSGTAVTTNTEPPAPATFAGSTWNAVAGGDFVGPDGQQIFDIVTLGDGSFVAVGQDGSGGTATAAAWRADDGTQWSRAAMIPIPAGYQQSQFLAATTRPDGSVLAVGRILNGAVWTFTAWTSPDGTAWTQSPTSLAPSPRVITDVVSHSEGYTAVGYSIDVGRIDISWWNSTDGLTWDEATLAETGDQAIFGATVFGGRIVAVGITQPDQDGAFSAGAGGEEVAVWTAPLSGGEFTLEAATGLSGPNDEHAKSVANGGPGLVAVGRSRIPGQPADAAVWTSPDGTAWTRQAAGSAELGGPGHDVMDQILDAGGVLIAAGRGGETNAPDLAVWQSLDGVGWIRVLAQPAPDWQHVYGAAWNGTTLVLGGITGPQGDFDAAVWTAQKTDAGSVTTVSTTTTTTTTTTLPGPTTVSNASWNTVVGGDLAGEGGQEIYDVVATATGYLAVGSSGHTAFWTSPDAVTWTAQPVAGLAGTRMLHMETAPDGTLVTVGVKLTDPPMFAAWMSPDGVTWTEQPPAGGALPTGAHAVNDLAAYPGGYVAVGIVVTGAESDAAWWTSPDGITWTAGTIAEPGIQQMLGVAVSDGVMVATGETRPNTGIWRAPVGGTFTRVDHTNLTTAVSDFDPSYTAARVFAWDIAAAGPGFVAVGADQTTAGNSAAAVWTSTDGNQWLRFGNETEYTPNMVDANFAGWPPWTVMDTVVESNGTIIVAGRTGAPGDPDLAIWESEDGFTWRQGAVGVLPGPQRPYNALAHNGRLIVVGVTGAVTQTPAADGAVWIATPDPDATRIGTWREVPQFEPVAYSEAWDATTIDNRIVAIGYHDSGAGIWESTNGTEWLRPPAAAAPAGQTAGLTSLTSLDGDFFATGFAYPEPAIWWSTDRSTWHKGATPALPATASSGSINGIRRAQGQLIAYGTAWSSTGALPLVWVSTDGRTWTDTGAEQTLGTVSIAGVADFAGRIVVAVDPMASSQTPRFWTSPNGRDWTPVPDHPAFAGFDPARVETFGGRLVIAGGLPVAGTYATAVLVTTDLQSWDLVVLDGASTPIRSLVSGIAVVGSQLMITGRSDQGWPTIWSTGDLTFWTRSYLPTAWGGWVRGVVRIGDRLVAVGSGARADDTPYATAWTGGNP